MKKKMKKCLRIQKQIFSIGDPCNDNKSYYQQLEDGLKYLELINLNQTAENCIDLTSYIIKLKSIIDVIELARSESLDSFNSEKRQMTKKKIEMFVKRNLTLKNELEKVRTQINNISPNSGNMLIFDGL